MTTCLLKNRTPFTPLPCRGHEGLRPTPAKNNNDDPFGSPFLTLTLHSPRPRHLTPDRAAAS
jgi:hypothetical protein